MRFAKQNSPGISAVIFAAYAAASPVGAQDFRVFLMSPSVLTDVDSVTINYDLPLAGFPDFEADFILFGVGTSKWSDNYQYAASEPNETAFMDPDFDYTSGEIDDGYREFLTYTGSLDTEFTQPRPQPGSGGALAVSLTPQKYLSPFGQSFTISAAGGGRSLDDGLVLTHDAIERGNSVGHVLFFGPEPKASLDVAPTAPPGALIKARVPQAGDLVEKIGSQCVVELLHAGRVHPGGARQGDWLLDRQVIQSGTTEYALDPSSIIRYRTGASTDYDSFLGAHLVELWCRGVLVDQKIVEVDLPKITLTAVASKEPDPESLPFEVRFGGSDLMELPNDPDGNPIDPTEGGVEGLGVPLEGFDEGFLSGAEPLDGGGLDLGSLENAVPDDGGLLVLPFDNSSDSREGGFLIPLPEAPELPVITVPSLEEFEETLTDLGGGSLEEDFGDLGDPLPGFEDFGDPSSTGTLDMGLPGSEDFGLPQDAFLYPVTASISGISGAIWDALSEDIWLSAIPKAADFSALGLYGDYAKDIFSGDGAEKQAKFLLPAGDYELRAYWGGDKGAFKAVELARMDLTVEAVEEDTSAGQIFDFGPGPSFEANTVQLAALDGDQPYYPATERSFSFASSADFSEHDLYVQFRRVDPYIGNCWLVEWESDAELRQYDALAVGQRIFPRMITGNEDSSEFSADFSDVFAQSGGSVALTLNIPEHAGRYALEVFATSKFRSLDAFTEFERIGAMEIDIEHPAGRIDLLNGDEIRGAGQQNLDISVDLSEGAGNFYQLRVVGLNGYLESRAHLDPNLKGRKGVTEKLVGLSEDDFDEAKRTALRRVGHASRMFVEGSGNLSLDRRLTGGGQYSGTVGPVYAENGQMHFGEVILADRNGMVLDRQRYKWSRFKDADYLEDFYFAASYPSELTPVAPSLEDRIQPDDPLRKRNAWLPTEKFCGGEEDEIVVSQAHGASDEALP